MEILGAIFARIMSAWGQKGIVGCNVMTIHNEALLLITSGLWAKALQHYSITVPKTHIKRSKIYSIFINIEVFCGIIIAD